MIIRSMFLAYFLLLSSLIYPQQVSSPNGNLMVSFLLDKNGTPGYEVFFKSKQIVKPSSLGIKCDKNIELSSGFSIISADTSSFDETWEPVLGEVKQIRNRYKELKVTLQSDSLFPKTMVITFRLFDDGLGLRYEFPLQKHLGHFVVKDEVTEFNLTGNHKAFWMPGDFDSNEHTYSETKLSEVDAGRGMNNSEILTRTIGGANVVQTPLLMKSADGIYISIFEAAQVNYPAMHLRLNKDTYSFTSVLVPDAVGNMAYLQTPALTPWRTIMVSDKAEDILNSKLILNLNEPTQYEDVSYIKPMKYVGIWWELHVDYSFWRYSDLTHTDLEKTDWSQVKPNGKHGATTERTKRYIDFAAEHGFDGVLVEGWNIGWEDWFGNWKENVFDFVTPYPDYDVEFLSGYAQERGVKLIMHHETSSSVTNYQRRMDEAFRFMKKYNYPAVKTGYVGRIIPRGEFHDGQWMSNHFVYTAKKAAEYGLMVNSHESARPTGLHRTYPNWIAAEAARGNEFNAWSSGNPPDHETILPFTRLLGGPMDYTPGIFETARSYYDSTKKERVHSTLVKQLALYVTMYSPLQMAADLPENYERYPDAFQFIKDVAADWDDTKILSAEPGDYICIARKAKGTENWFLGAITDENERIMTIKTDFLTKGKKYNAIFYEDGDDAHWEKNPKSYKIKKTAIKSGDKITLTMKPGGGAAISFVPAE